MTDPATFWSKVVKTDNCWWWTAGMSGVYGIFKYKGKVLRAHQVSFALSGGHVPVGYEIDHLCRHTLCVNPAHLEAVTPTVNKQRRHRDNPHRLCRAGLHDDTVKNAGRSGSTRYCKPCRAARVRKQAMSEAPVIIVEDED